MASIASPIRAWWPCFGSVTLVRLGEETQVPSDYSLDELWAQMFTEAIVSITPADAPRIMAAYSAIRESVRQRLETVANGSMHGFFDEFDVLWNIVNEDDYPLAWEKRAAILVALSYFVSSDDTFPQFVSVLGYCDDAVVIAWITDLLSDEVAKYRASRPASP